MSRMRLDAIVFLITAILFCVVYHNEGANTVVRQWWTVLQRFAQYEESIEHLDCDSANSGCHWQLFPTARSLIEQTAALSAGNVSQAPQMMTDLYQEGLFSSSSYHPPSLFRDDAGGERELVCSLRGDFEYTMWAHSAVAFQEMRMRWPSRIVLALHMTMDRFPELLRRCNDWRGPLSVAIFVGSSSKQASEILDIIKSYHCLSSYADVHLVRRSSLEIDDGNITVREQIAGKRLPSGMFTYPFNSVRNCAVMGSRGGRVFLLDVDLEVRPKALASHDGLLHHLNLLQTIAHGPNGTLYGKRKEKIYWVIGGFETSSRLEPLPLTIQEFAEKKLSDRLTWFYPDCETCYATLDIDLFTNNSLRMESQLFGIGSPFYQHCAQEPAFWTSRSGTRSDGGQWDSRLHLIQKCIDFLVFKARQRGGRSYYVKTMTAARQVLSSMETLEDPTFELLYRDGMEPFFVIEKRHFLPQSEDFIGRNCDKVQVYPEYRHYGYTPHVATGVGIINAGRGDAPTHLHLGRKKSAAYEFKENQNFVAYQNFLANLQRRKRWDEWQVTHPFSVRSRDDYFSHVHHRDDIVIPHRPWSRFVAVTASKLWQEKFVTYKHNETIVCILRTPQEADMDPAEWETKLQATLKKACQEIDCSSLEEGGFRYYPNGLIYHADWILHHYWKHHFLQTSDNHASYCVNGGIGDLVVSHESCFSCIPRDTLSVKKMQLELDALCNEDELGDCRALFEDQLGSHPEAMGDIIVPGESKKALWSERSLRFRLALAMTLHFSLQEPHNPITPIPGGHRHDTSSFCQFGGTAIPIMMEDLWWFQD